MCFINYKVLLTYSRERSDLKKKKEKKNLQHRHLLHINAAFHPAVRVWERILAVKQDEFRVVQ